MIDLQTMNRQSPRKLKQHAQHVCFLKGVALTEVYAKSPQELEKRESPVAEVAARI